MQLIINILFFIILLICFYQKIVKYKIIRKIKKLNFKRYKSKNFKNQKIVNNLEVMLKRCGNPFGINAKLFIKINLTLLIISLISLFLGYLEIFTRIAIILICFNLVIIINYYFQNSSIYTDLMYVVQSMYLQMSSGVSLKDSLMNISVLCENKRFKKSIISLSTVYQLSGYDVKKSTETLEKEYNMPEIKLFINALNQQISSEVSLEILESLYSSLKDKYIERLRVSTKVKIIYITFGVVIILANVCALAIIPMFMLALKDLNSIFN